jgi:gamma-glutamyltranspeptidase/glutathione hydrolase
MRTRPNAYGLKVAASTGHPAATMAAIEILDAGGNAFDAAAAASLAMAVAHPDLVTFFGVAAIMVRPAKTGEVTTLAGVGGWPAAASIAYFNDAHGGIIPEGLPRTVVPGAPDAWLSTLGCFGTLGFAEAAAPAIRLAKAGCPITDHVAESFAHYAASIARMPSSAATYFKNGGPPSAGQVLVLEDLAGTLTFLSDVDIAARRCGRHAGLNAVKEAIYRGDIAALITSYHCDHGGLLTRDDMAAFTAAIEPAVSVKFFNADLAACGAWCQGPVLAQLALLNSLQPGPPSDPDSEAFLHVFAETVKLAMADRTAYIGDPAKVDVPLQAMLNSDYLAGRYRLIGERALADMPPGAPRDGAAIGLTPPWIMPSGEAPAHPNTAGITVVDSDGNLCAATVSDVAVDTPVIPRLGCPVSSRGSQGWLHPDHPARVAPGHRPWLTACPAILQFRDRSIWGMASAGGDVQPQAMLQTLLRMVRGADAQAAIDAPRFESRSFPDAFWPHSYKPGLLRIESEFERMKPHLEGRGHRTQLVPSRDARLGAVVLSGVSAEGVRMAAADGRRDAIALAR